MQVKPLVTASSIYRYLECPGFPILPHTEGPVSEAAEIGTMVHTWMDGEIGKESMPPAARLVAEHFNRAKWLSTYELREQAYGWSPLTGEFFSFGRLPGPRQYPDLDVPYIAGTVDGVGELLGLPVVDDIKTGRKREYYRLQVEFLLMCVSKGEGGTCRLTYRDERPTWTVTNDRMRELREQLVAAYKESLFSQRLVDIGKKPVVNPGKHCQWCPAKADCHAEQKPIRRRRK